MSKGRVLKMALDEIVGGVKKVDLGDLTKKVNVSDRVEAVKRMLGDAGEAIAEKADDWGWKGGKEGEITGTKWKRALDSYNAGRISANDYENVLKRAYGQFENAASRGKPVGARLAELQRLYGYGDGPVQKKLANLEYEDRVGIAEQMLEDFYILEKAGVPRRLTGQLQPRLPELMRNNTYQHILRSNTSTKADVGIGDYARAFKETYGRYLSGMRPDQQETFLSLLPEWAGSLDELAEAARTI